MLLLFARPATAGVLRLSAFKPGVPITGVRAPGPLVWQEGGDLVLWDGSTRRQITSLSNDARDQQQHAREFQWQANDGGQVVWRGWDGHDYEIYLWDGARVVRLSDNDQDDEDPQINDAGQVVWSSEGQIYLWDGATVQALTPPGTFGQEPRINRSGMVVWTGGEVYLWDGDTVRQITSGSTSAYDATINDAGQVAWVIYKKLPNRTTDSDVFLWDGSRARRLATPDVTDYYPQITNKGQVVWLGEARNETALSVYLWDGGTIRRFPGRFFQGDRPQVNQGGQVVWPGDGIELWDGAQARRLAIDNSDYPAPRINDAGQVTWRGKEGAYPEIYLWDGRAVRKLTHNAPPHPDPHALSFLQLSAPQLFNSGQVLFGVGGLSPANAGDLFLYTPPAPGSLELEPTPVWGGEMSLATVTLPRAAPAGGAVVALASADPKLASVPAKVTVAAGETSATFPVTTSAVPGTLDVAITAVSGSSQWTAPLRIMRRAIAAFSLEDRRVVGGTRTNGRLSFELPRTPGQQSLGFRSENPALAWVREEELHTPPDSSAEATFIVWTAPVKTVTPVRLYVTYGGRTWAALLTLLPVGIARVSVAPERVPSGSTATGTIQLTGPAPAGGVLLNLHSSDWGHVVVPPRVTVPEGAASVSFPVTTLPAYSGGFADIDIGNGAGLLRGGFTLLASPNPPLYFQYPSIGGTIPTSLELKQPRPPAGTLITLTSDRPDVVSVPASLFAPNWQQWATFEAEVHPVAAFTVVRITASSRDQKWVVEALVYPQAGAGIRWGQDRVVGGRTLLGQVSLAYPAPPGGLFVPLSSSDPSVVAVPAGVTVPAGATEILFRVTVAPVANPTQVRVSTFDDFLATSPLVTALTVLPEALTSLKVTPASVVGGRMAEGTVTLSGPAPSGGAIVRLSLPESAGVSVPSTVTVPAGALGVSFPIRTAPVPAPRTVQLSASWDGEIQTAVLTLTHTSTAARRSGSLPARPR